jgi:hypothetical protein
MSGGVPGAGGPPGGARSAGPNGPSGFAGPGSGSGRGGIGAPLGNDRASAQAIAYAKRHGGGTVAVSSQSSAASAIVGDDASVAGIGGFSGRESDVSVAWLAGEVRRGAIRWVLAEGSGPVARAPRLPGDTRAGSRKAMAAVTRACLKVTLPSSATGGAGEAAGGRGGSPSGGRGGAGGGESTLYDCRGRAAALLGTKESAA